VQLVGQPHLPRHEQQEAAHLDAPPIQGVRRGLGRGLEHRETTREGDEATGAQEEHAAVLLHERTRLGGGVDPHMGIFGNPLSP
jgi:hypothetical protein